MTNLITASLLAMVCAVADADRTELKDDLVAMSSTAADADAAGRHAERCEQIWATIERLPPRERAVWRNTFTAALSGHLHIEKKDDDAPSRVASIKYYRALFAALSNGAAPGLANRIKHALAVSIDRHASRMPPDRRKPLKDEAARLQTEAASYFQDAGDRVMLAMTLGDLGLLYFTTGDADQATPAQEKAVRLYESLPESFLETVDLELQQDVNERVAGWAKRGYSRQSEVYLLLALTNYNAGLEDPELAREAIHLYAESLRVGFVHQNTTAVNNASALLIQRNLGDQTGKARRIRHLFRILNWLPDTESNPHWHDREITKTEQAVNWIHARVRHYLGEFYAQTGQILLARHNFNEAEAKARKLEDGSILPLVLYSLAESWADLGVTDEALRSARQALDAHPLLNRRANILLLMGRVCQRQGDFDRAQDYHRWALDLFVKPGSFNVNAKDLAVMARIRRASALMQMKQGRVAEGLDALGEAANIAAIESPASALEMQLDRLLAAHWIAATDRYAPSVEVVQALDADSVSPYQSLAMTRGPNFSKTVKLVQPKPNGRRPVSTEPLALSAGQIQHIRSALRQRSELDTSEVAEETLKGIAKLQKRSGQGPAPGYDLARFAIVQGDFDAAAKHLTEELDVEWRTSGMNLDPTLGIESPEQVQRTHHLGAVVAARQGKLERALQVLDMSRHRALWQVHSSRQHVWERLDPKQRIDAARLDDARTSAGRLARQLSRRAAADPRFGNAFKQAQQQLLEAEAEWRSFTQEIHKTYQVETPSMRPLRTQDLKDLLPEKSVVLSFSVGDYETCVVTAARRGESVEYGSQVLPIRRHELGALVNALRMGCSRREGRYRLLARELYRVLIAPLQDRMADAELLVICPDGPLNVLPFALLEDQRGVPLLERYPIAVVPSLALLKRLRDTKSEEREGALLVGLQQFNNRVWVPSSYASQLDASSVAELLPQYQLSDLRQTKSEVERIASLFGNKATVLINENASESKVNSALRGRRYLHFATHGLIDSHNPFESALVLSAPGPDSREDGFLEASEILENPAFSGAELVTLSACESGLGLVQGGEGVLGLTWAFLAAGNRGVVSSLWSVNDTATAELMVGLYRELANGRNKAEALRLAALKVRADPKTSHAAYWAAFQFTGDWSIKH